MDWFNPFEGSEGGGGGSGTDNYNELINKPSINNVVLSGNKTEDDLGLQKKISSNNKISSDNVSDLGAQNLFTNATEKQVWNAKQDAIQNLQDIQNGAAAGATAVQTISINGVQQTKDSGNIDLPAYPTTLPASDTTNLYDPTGTSPISGKGVAAAIGTLDVAAVGGSGSFISGISETNGKISATPTTMDTSLSNSSTNNSCPTSKTVYDDQQRQETEIGAVANAGAKNLFKNTAVSKTYLGVTFTVNEDGTVSLSGAATAAASVLEIGTVTPPAGSYIVSGCPAGGSWAPNPNKYRIRIAKNGAWLGDEKGTGYTVTVNGSDVISLQVNSAVGFDTAGLVFKPMIRPASITDSTYVPYAPTNYELYETKTEQNETNVIANLGAKNNADFNFGGVVQNVNVKPGTIVCTESNGIFSFSGASDDKNYAAYVLKQLLLKAGTYKISGVSGGSNTTYWMRIGTGTTDTALFNLYDAEREFNIASDTLITVQVVIYANQTVSNLVFKPMIRPAVITDDTFVPYAKTNRELTVENDSQQSEIDYAINTGVKNLFPVTASGTQTIGGVDFTVHADGTITANGTKTNNDWLILSENNSFGAGTYTLSDGLPVDTTDCQLIITTARSMTAAIMATAANARPQTKTFNTAQTGLYYAIRIASGKTVNNLTFKPMIRPASITDNTFVPYALPNPTLTPAAVKSVDEGAKNLIQNNCNSKTVHGVTATTNADGSITVSGSSDYTNDFLIMYDLYAGDSATSSYNSHLTLKAGTYVNKGTGRSDVKLQIVEYNTSSDYSIVSAGDTDTTFTLTKSYFVARLWCSKTANFSTPVTVYPMICTAADYAVSQKFVPYALPNPVITPALIEQVDNVAKNICNWSASTSTISGVTFTMNPDKTVSTSGTATARSQIGLAFTIPSTLKAGRYVLSGCPSGGAQSGTIYYCLYIWDQTAVARVSSNDTGNGSEFDWTPDPSHTYTITVDVRSGSNATGLIFKPMICTASDWAVSQKFVPYAPTNRELFEEKIGIEDVFGVQPQIADNTDLNTLQTIGKYVCGGLAKAQTLLNCPMQGAFIMLVDAVGALTRLIQRIYGFDTGTGEISVYIRALTLNGWGSWYKFEGTVMA